MSQTHPFCPLGRTHQGSRRRSLALWLVVLGSLLLAQSSWGQTDSVLEWTYGSGSYSTNATTLNGEVTNGSVAIAGYGVTTASTITSGNYLMRTNNWANSATIPYTNASYWTSLAPVSGDKAVHFTFALDPTAAVDFTNLSLTMSYRRVTSAAPKLARAYLIWNDGGVKRRYSPEVSLGTSTGTIVNNLTFELNGGGSAGTALPADLAGQTFHVEVTFYSVSSTTNQLDLDNVKLLATGLAPGHMIGNLVYGDDNRNGVYDSGEGMGGVTVDLLDSANNLLQSTTTATSGSVGKYLFTNLPAGSYKVRIPASEFASGKDLHGYLSIAPSSPTDNSVDDNMANNDDGVDSATPASTGILSPLIALVDNGEVTTEAGFSAADDNADDNNGNLTVDFGFVPNRDYGDLPDISASTGVGNYATLLAHSGPYHVINANMRLGASNDAESDGQQNSTASGDGASDDGIATFPTFYQGSTASVSVSLLNNVAAAYLYAFFDWNNDGDFADSGEAITPLAVATNASQQTVTLSVPVPSSAINGSTAARFRLSSTASLTSTGPAADGEVEDYFVTTSTAIGRDSPFKGYSVIVSNNFSATSDVEGATMVKNFTGTSSVTMSKNMSGTPGATQTIQVQSSMAAGGSINLQYGSLYAPSAAAINGRGVNYNGGSGAGFQTSPAPDFASAFSLLSTASSAYSLYSSTGTITIPSSPSAATFVVTSLTPEGVAVFNVDGNALLNNSNVQQIDLNVGAFSPTAILINCTGTTVTGGASGNFVGNMTSSTWRPKIVWNFYQATSITFNKSIYGSILAPLASISASGGAIEGSVACTNYSTTVETHLPAFTGGIPYLLNDYGDHSGFPDTANRASTNLKIGSNATDTEADTPTAASATGDDTTGTDDEDLSIPSLTSGSTTAFNVPVTSSLASARLGVWADWNGDGDFLDAGEVIASSITVNSGTANYSVNLSPPSGTTAGTKYLRFRVMEGTAAPPSSGISTALGEVEDYAVTVVAPTLDFGDHSALADAASTASTAIRLGATVDAEASANKDASALGDDNNGTDDEDGVAFPASVSTTGSFSCTATVTNTSGATAYLSAWVDWDRNGTLATTEKIIDNYPVASGVTDQDLTFYAAPPYNATAGTCPVRFRFANTSGVAATGTSGTGEVEDTTVVLGTSYAACGVEMLYNGSFEYGSLNPVSTDFSATGTDEKFPNATLQTTYNAKYYSSGHATAIPGWALDPASWVHAPGKATDGNKFVWLARPGYNSCLTLPVRVGSIGAGDNASGPLPALQLGKTYRMAFDWAAFDKAQPNGSTTESEGPAIEFSVYDSSMNFLSSVSFASTVFRNRYDGSAVPSTQKLQAWSSINWNTFYGTLTVPATLPAGSAHVQIWVSETYGKGILLDNMSLMELCTCPAFTISPATLPSGAQASPYVQGTPFSVSGATGLYSLTVSNLPAGLTYDDATKSIVGTPTVTGTFSNVIVNAYDGYNCTGSKTYSMTITPPPYDYGDYAPFGSANSTASTTLRMGAAVDTEGGTLANANATGDDTTATDDEDGVTFPAVMTAGASTSITVQVTNTTGAAAYLNAWIDFNNNNSLTDSGEQIATNMLIANGLTNSNQTVTFTVPSGATLGTVGARFRLTPTQNPGSTGYSGGLGEVEDHRVTISGYSIGNLVWNDVNNDGLKAAGEAGIGGVTVQLFQSTQNPATDTPVATTATATSGNIGSYRFTGIVPGTYFVHIPRTNFFVGSPLARMVSTTGSDTDSGKDDSQLASDNGQDQAYPAGTGVRSIDISLSGLEPTNAGTETGFANTLDDAEGDAAGDMTVDFAFHTEVSSSCFAGNGARNPSFELGTWAQAPAGNTLGGLPSRQIPTNSGPQDWSLSIPSTEPGEWVNASSAGGAKSGSLMVWLRPSSNDGPCVFDSFSSGINTQNSYQISVWAAAFDPSAPSSSYAKAIVEFCSSSNGTDFAPDPVDILGVSPGGTATYLDVTGGAATKAASVYSGGAWDLRTSNPRTTTGSAYTGTAGQVLDPKTLNWQRLWIRIRPNYQQLYLICSQEKGTSKGLFYDEVNFECGTFTEYLGIGNLVFRDLNTNGRYDSGEGQDGVHLDLYDSGNNRIATTTTYGGGEYLFSGLTAGSYTVRVPASEFVTGRPLFGYYSVVGAGADAAADDGVDENGVDQAAPNVTGVSSGTIVLTVGGEPTNAGAETGFDKTGDDAADSNYDLTVDFGFSTPTQEFGDFSGFGMAASTMSSALKMGALVDAEPAWNADSLASADDASGVDDEDGATLPGSVTLGQPASFPVKVTNTTGATAYLNAWIDFNNDGDVLDSGEQVATNVSVANGSNDVTKTVSFTVPATAVTAAVGLRLRLTTASSPGSVGSISTGEVEDYLINVRPINLGVGNLVWVDDNDNGRFDTGEGAAGITVQLLNTSNAVVASTVTDAFGLYHIYNLAPGTYYLKIPGSEFGAGKRLNGKFSMVGAGGDTALDDDWDDDGIDNSAPATNGVRSANFTLALGAEPLDAAETGQDGSWDNNAVGIPADADCDLTHDFAFVSCNRSSILLNGSFESGAWSGTGTFVDANNSNNHVSQSNNTDITYWGYDPGAWVQNATKARDGSRFMYLKAYSCAWYNMTVDGPQPSASWVQGGSITSGKFYLLEFDWAPFDHTNPNATGTVKTARPTVEGIFANVDWTSTVFQAARFDFVNPRTGATVIGDLPCSPWSNLNWQRARYEFFMPPPPSGMPLFQFLFTAETESGGGGVIFDNAKITELCGSSQCGVGNVVFADANGNGRYDAGEGVDGVTVRLFREGQSTSDYFDVDHKVTIAGGQFYFSGLPPGNYFLHIPNSQFTSGNPLYGKVSLSGPAADDGRDDNDAAGDNGVDNAAPATNGISSNIFTLGLGTEPTSSTTETGLNASSDDIADSNVDLTIDLGFTSAAVKDYGDLAGYPDASSTKSTSLRMGANVDTETHTIGTAEADGDDNTGTPDDEDGVTVTALTRNQSGTVTIVVTNQTGSAAYLSGWIDYNNNKVFTDSGEQIVANQTIATGSSNVTKTYTFTVPSTAVVNTPVGARFRIANSANPASLGAVGSGEVEDYALTILPLPGIGSLVYQDLNYNGVYDAGVDQPISGAVVSLYKDANSNGIDAADAQIGTSVTTAANGIYGFSNLAAGKYWVKVTPPSGSTWFASTNALTTDPGAGVAGADNRNYANTNALDAAAFFSPVIDLAVGTEPGVAIDGDDASTNSLIDFGLVKSVGIGNLVWIDTNDDGLKGASELGLAGAVVTLYTPGADNAPGGSGGNADTVVGTSVTTNSTGAYSFTGLRPGRYFVKVVPPASFVEAGGTPSILDDDVDGDNNALTHASYPGAFISPVVELVPNGEPAAAEDGSDAWVNSTVDFGLVCPALGIMPATLPAGVYNSAYVQPTAFSASGGTGSYSWSVSGLPPGMAFNPATLKLEGTPTQIGWFRPVVLVADTAGCTGTRLYQLQITGCGASQWVYTWDRGIDTLDGGDQGGTYRKVTMIDNVTAGTMDIAVTFDVSTQNTQAMWFTITNGPTPATGDTDYAAVYCIGGNYYVTPYSANPTTTHALSTVISSGTYSVVNQGTLRTFSFQLNTAAINGWAAAPATWKGIGFPIDAQGNAWGNASTPYRLGAWARAFADGSASYAGGTWTVTWGAGADLNIGAWDGAYDFGSGCCGLQLAPATVPGGQQFYAYAGAQLDANWGVPPYSFALKASSGPLPSGLTLSAAGQIGGMPMASGTFNFTVEATDNWGCKGEKAYSINVAPTILGLGDLIYEDKNYNGVYDAAVDSPVAGATVKLFSTGADNAIGGSGGNADTQVGAAVVTPATGLYSFLNLIPGKYYVTVTPPGGVGAWFAGASVLTSDPGAGAAGANGRNYASLNALDGAAFFSPVVDLAPGAEAGVAVDGDDANINALIDFGIWHRMTLGDTVWRDENNNGSKDAGETGLPGIGVRLFTSTKNPLIDAPDAVTTTDWSGNYYFTGVLPGTYYLYIPTPPAAFPKVSDVSVNADNDVNNDNNGLQAGGSGTAVRSPNVTLSPLNEPTTDGDGSNGNLTLDFGFQVPSGINPAPCEIVVSEFHAQRIAVYDPSTGSLLRTFATVPGSVAPTSFEHYRTTFASDGTLFMSTGTGNSVRRFSASSGADLGNFVTASSGGLGTAAHHIFGPDGSLYVADPGSDRILKYNGSTGAYTSVFKGAGFVDGGSLYTLDQVAGMAWGPDGNLYVVNQGGSGRVAVLKFNSGGTFISAVFDATVSAAVTGSPALNSLAFGADGALYLPDGNTGRILRLDASVSTPPASPQIWATVGGISSAGFRGIAMNPNTGNLWVVKFGGPSTNGAVIELNRSTGATVRTVVTGNGSQDVLFRDTCGATLAVGNLIFKDANQNSRYDSGEGVSGVKVRLYAEGATANSAGYLAETTSGTGGAYVFSGLNPGRYFIHVPSTEFATGKPLDGHLSIPGGGADDVTDDDVDENGIDQVFPATTGVSSPVFALNYGAEATTAGSGTEKGFQSTSDDADDANANLTIDLGFTLPLNPVAGGMLLIDDIQLNGQFTTDPASQIQPRVEYEYITSAGTQTGSYGVVESATGAAVGSYQNIAWADLPGGWKRVSATFTAPTTTNNNMKLFIGVAGHASLADGYGGMLVDNVALREVPTDAAYENAYFRAFPSHNATGTPVTADSYNNISASTAALLGLSSDAVTNVAASNVRMDPSIADAIYHTVGVGAEEENRYGRVTYNYNTNPIQSLAFTNWTSQATEFAGDSKIPRFDGDPVGAVSSMTFGMVGFQKAQGPAGQVWATAIQPDGKIVIGGEFGLVNNVARKNIARLNADGTLDASFNPGTGFDGAVYALKVQGDGKILAGGAFGTLAGNSSPRLARLTSAGAFDGSFTTPIDSGATSVVNWIDEQTDGKLLVGGKFTSPAAGVARLSSSGAVDSGFNVGTGVGTGVVNEGSILPDGSVMIVGDFATYNGTTRVRGAKLKSDGSLDPSWNPAAGFSAEVASVALASSGNLYTAGMFSQYRGNTVNKAAFVNVSHAGQVSGFNAAAGMNATKIWRIRRAN